MPLRSATVYQSDDPAIRIHRRSHISSFVNCPSRLAAEDKWDSGIDPVARMRGNLFHSCAEYVLKSVKAGWKAQDVDIEPVLEKNADIADAAIQAEVRELVKAWQIRWDFPTPIEVEQLCTSTILTPDESPDRLTHQIGGTIDLACEPNNVWDWKTAYACLSQEAAQEDIQVGSYALLASDRYGWEEVAVSVAFVRWGVTRRVEFDLDSILDWEQRLKAHLLNYLVWESQMEKEDPETKRAGPHCATCPILSRCDSAAPAAIVNVDDAGEFGNHLAKLRAQSPAMSSSLIEWLQQNPESHVKIGERYYGLGLSGSHKCEDAESLAAICKEQGIDFWRCLSVDKQKLASLCKKNPGLEAAIAHLVVDRRKPALVSIKERNK